MNTLIVARYVRDTDWLTDLPDGWVSTVITAGEDRDNQGRDPGTFLWWITRNYKLIQPDLLYAFVQDDALGHDKDLWMHLVTAADGFRWLGDDGGDFMAGSTGLPHHAGLPVAKLHLAWTGREFPGPVLFAPGGQFMLPGRLLLAHPPELYERMYGDILVGEQAWVLERLWEAVLGGANGDEADVLEPE